MRNKVPPQSDLHEPDMHISLKAKQLKVPLIPFASWLNSHFLSVLAQKMHDFVV